MTLTPRTLRITLAVLALCLAGIVALPSPVVILEFVYSPDAKEILDPHIAAFNAEFEGDVRIEGEAEASGTVLSEIEGGRRTPDLWMPAASAWGDLLDLRSGKDLVPEDNPSLFWSPEMIVIWRDVREAIEKELGPVGWEEMVELSTDPSAFAKMGARYASLDPFRFGHTKPTKSTSGLYAVASEFQLAAGTSRLTPAMIDEHRGRVEQIEHSIVHYGDIGKDFCDLMHVNGPQYVSASYMQETTWLGCLEDVKDDTGLDLRLDAVAPKAGTFVADYPIISLHAPWSEGTEDETALFVQWLSEHIARTDVAAHHFRFGEPRGDAEPPPDERAPREADIRIHDPLSAETLDAVQGTWLEVRKPANILFVLDRSYKMNAERQSLAASLICDVVANLAEEAQAATSVVVDDPVLDQIGLIAFGDEVKTPVRMTPVDRGSDVVCDEASDTAPNSTRSLLYDAIAQAMVHPALDAGPTIDAIIVVSYGEDAGSSIGLGRLESLVRDGALPQSPLQVITVALGDPNGELEQISVESRTRPFDINDEDLADDLAALV